MFAWSRESRNITVSSSPQRSDVSCPRLQWSRSFGEGFTSRAPCSPWVICKKVCFHRTSLHFLFRGHTELSQLAWSKQISAVSARKKLVDGKRKPPTDCSLQWPSLFTTRYVNLETFLFSDKQLRNKSVASPKSFHEVGFIRHARHSGSQRNTRMLALICFLSELSMCLSPPVPPWQRWTHRSFASSYLWY